MSWPQGAETGAHGRAVVARTSWGRPAPHARLTRTKTKRRARPKKKSALVILGSPKKWGSAGPACEERAVRLSKFWDEFFLDSALVGPS